MLHTLQNCQKRTSVKGGKGDEKDAVDPFPTGSVHNVLGAKFCIFLHIESLKKLPWSVKTI